MTRRSLFQGAAAFGFAAAWTGVSTAAAPDILPPLPPPLPGDAFRERQDRMRAWLRREGLDALFIEPGTNLRYTANISTGRSERLIALLLTAGGSTIAVAPFFEKPRVERGAAVDEVQTWQEAENPYSLCARIVGRNKKIGVEGSVSYSDAMALRDASGGELRDATEIFHELRSVKSEAEQGFIRAAGRCTLGAITATWKRLHDGVTEEEGARALSEEFDRFHTPSEGLVQFGASSALPHGGPGEKKLAAGDVVLIDTGCFVQGYSSDITRSVCFGKPSDKIRRVYQIVLRAQRAGIAALRAGTPGEDVDRAARRVIDEAGYGAYFTHRVGHGLGMDGHEVPYLVGGNRKPLVAGNVNTVEPGVYLPGEFGIRIEDDLAVTSSDAVRLSGEPAADEILSV